MVSTSILLKITDFMLFCQRQGSEARAVMAEPQRSGTAVHDVFSEVYSVCDLCCVADAYEFLGILLG